MRFKEQGNVIFATILVGALFLGLAVGGWFLFQWFDANDPTMKEIPAIVPTNTISELPSRPNPVNERSELSQQLQDLQDTLDSSSNKNSLLAGFALHEIGATAWSDAEFAELSKLLQSNPDIRKHIALEFRINTDPKKAKRLTALLGQFDDKIITDVGLELALSGEAVSQKSGLALLGKQQPHNANARAAISEILHVVSEPEILVSALNAMAIPASTNETEQRDLLDQFASLSNNPDPKVRSHSMAVMSKWSRGMDVNEYLLVGLKDDDPGVRKTAAYSLIKTRHLSDDVKYSLLSRASDSTEQKRTREAALMGLERFKLTEAEQQQVSISKADIRKPGR